MRKRFILSAAVLALTLCLAGPSWAEGELAITGTDGGWTYEGEVLTITKGGAYEIAMTPGTTITAHSVYVNPDVKADITLRDVHIDTRRAAVDAGAFRVAEDSVVNLTLAGKNALRSGGHYAGLGVLLAELTIGGEGSLDAVGGDGGEGISANHSTLRITGGEVAAFGGAGDGGGDYNSGGAAGIGGENEALIIITGGAVHSEGNGNAPGIGGRQNAWITIEGGSVTAVGGENGGRALEGRVEIKATAYEYLTDDNDERAFPPDPFVNGDYVYVQIDV